MIKTSVKTQFALAILAMIVTTALVYADETIYLSASVGSTDLEQSTDFPIDDDATAFRFGLGYGLGNDIAIEANYINLGDFTGNTGLDDIGISGEVEGAALSAVFSLPIAEQWAINVRGGLMAWESELRTPAFREKRDGSDVFYGIGLEANLTEQVALIGEWQRFELDESEADVLFATLRFRF